MDTNIEYFGKALEVLASAVTILTRKVPRKQKSSRLANQTILKVESYRVFKMAESDSKAKQVQADAEVCASYLKALGDANRLQIMRALRTSPLTVTDLSLLLDSEMANVSHHLRVLFHAGLVTTQRDGKFIYYQINRDIVRHRTVTSALDLGCCRIEMHT